MRHRPLRRTRAHLDSVIEGRPTQADPLVDLVAAVRAPAQPHELGGLDAAVAAFAAAPGVAPSPEEKTPMLKSVAGRLLALKILAVTAGAAAAGGVAYAATADHIGTPNAHSAVAADESSSAAPGSSGAPGSETESSDEPSSAPGGGTESSGTESSPSESKAAPSPSLVGLCTAWLAHPRDITKVSTNPAFSVLIKAAGGGDAVNGYCTTLLATARPSHPVHPTHPAHPSHPAHPTQAKNSSHTKPAHPTQAKNTKAPNPHKTSH
jgi:hypothetical protein